MRKKTFGKIFTGIILILLVLFMNKILTKESFGADEEKVVLEGSLNKYINYNLQNQEQGTLVQYTLKAGIEYGDDYYPVKNSELTVSLNQIDGKFPYDVKIITRSTKVTNGKTSDLEENYSYDSNTGTLKINANNENENSEPINNTRISQEDRDEYIIIAYYDTYTAENPERDLSYDVTYKAVLFTDENKEITGQGRLESKVTENISELTSVNISTDEVYNGYMKSNVTNGTSYDTQYKETQEIMISKKDVQQKVYITEDNEFINTNDIQYKSTKILKEDIVNLLGENGKLEIFDENDNIIATIDNTTEFNENGESIIVYPENTNKIFIKTSNIENIGRLRIENEKVIKADVSNLEDTDIKTKVEVKGINEEKIVKENIEDSVGNTENIEEVVEKEVYKVEKENIINVKNAGTNVEMTVDNTQWTNRKQNEVTFDITLDSTSIKYNLFENPTLKIDLPSQVEKVILGNTSIVYANGLTLDNVYTQSNPDGILSIIADLGGKQTQYNENDLGLKTNVKISATIILRKDIESTQDELNLDYTNDYNNKEKGNIKKDITIENYEEVQKEESSAENNSNILEEGNDLISTITEAAEKNVKDTVRTATAEEIEGLKVEIQPVRGDTNLKDGDTVYEGEYIKYNINITNTLDKDIEDIKIIGEIPEGVTYGELNADYYSYGGVYEYEFDEDLTQKEIEVGTLKAGQSISQFYEVRVNDLEENIEEKQITSNIKTYIGSTEILNYDLNNVVKSSSVKVFLSAHLDSIVDKWYYSVELDNPNEEEVTIDLKVPERFEPGWVIDNGSVLDESEIEYKSGNVISITTKTNGICNFEGYLRTSKLEEEIGTNKLEVFAVATITTKDGIIFKTNENRIQLEGESASVTMTSSNEGEEVKYGDEIVYDITVTNTGRTNLNNSVYNNISVTITDYLPENVDPISVTYEDYEILNEDTLEVAEEPTEKTLDISNIEYDENGNRLPNVNLNVIIPYEKSINIKVKTKAGYVYEKTKVENSVVVEGQRITTKTSNVVTHIILPYDYIEEPDNPDNPDPEEPDNPDNPDPEDPDNPEDGTQKYSISGKVWNDENGDGQRQQNENTLMGITAMLVDMSQSNKVKESITTTSNGEYSFSNLESGTYIVVFKYNTELYSITQYKANGISNELNSDVTAQDITLNGESVSVGVTDTIKLNANITNIDMGLIENKSYNLKLDKYISNVEVQTNKTSKQYSYNNTKLAKIEIKAKEVEGATVNVTYNIVVTNNGKVATTINEIVDTIPQGMEFVSSSNMTWTEESNNKVVNRSMINQPLQPGESKTITLILTKTMSAEETGTFTNKAEIGEIGNGSKIQDIDRSDNISQADLLISISTGAVLYISIAVLGVIILAVIIIFIIKGGKYKKSIIKKLSLFLVIFIATVTMQISTFAATAPSKTYFKNIRGCTWITRGGEIPHATTNYTLSNLQCPICGSWGTHSAHGNPPSGGTVCTGHLYQSWSFSGGPQNEGGTCANSTADARYYGNNWSLVTDKGEYSGRVEISGWKTDFTLTLNKLNDQIGMKKLDDDYILGPFQVSSSYDGAYSYEIYDSNGDKITEYNTCDENGNNTNVTGTAIFYLKISEKNMTKGISRVKITISETRKCKYYSGFKAQALYWAPVTQGETQQKVRTNNVYDFIESEVNKDRTKTASVEWTNFNVTLDIIKQDADDSDVKLSGVEINLKSDKLGYDKTFYTDENGKIHIDNLAPGTYQITENINPNYGYGKKESEEIALHSGMVRLYSLTNEKQTGNLQIVKQDSDTGKFLENVVYTVRDENENYVVGVDTQGNKISEAKGEVYLSNMQTTENEDEATKFITDSQGLIKVHNILVGTYTVEEISVGDDNYGYDIDDDYISWETDEGNGQGTVSTIGVTRQKSYTTVPESNIIVDNQKVIEDGTYEIQSNVGANKAIEVSRGHAYNGSNITLYDRNKSISQKFYIRYLGQGYYSIISLYANKYVEVAGGSTSPGANVQISTGNGTDAQIWKIQDEGDGNYSIISKASGLYMDVYNGLTANDTNIQVSTSNGSKGQRYKLNDLTDVSGATETGFSTITYNNRRKYVKLSGNVWEDIQWEKGKNETMNQLYRDVEDDIKDQLLENITVKLKDKNGNSVAFKDKDGNIVQNGELLTDEKGNYLMEDVLIDQLENYYIEFSYNGMAYENVDLIDINKPNGTHAIEGEYRTEFDESFAKITYQGNSSSSNVNKSYSGQSNNSNNEKVNDILYNQTKYESNIDYEGDYLYGYYKSTEAEYNDIYTTKEEYETYYPVNGVAEKYLISATTKNAYESVGGTGYITDIMTAEEIRKNAVTEIDEGLDLGLKKRERPDMSVIKDLKSAKVSINNESHIYEYQERYDNEMSWDKENETYEGFTMNPTIKFEEKYATKTYTRALYESDILYEGDNPLEVYVTYKIGVRNNATNINAKIYELQDYFDTKYELVNVGLNINEDGSIKSDSIINGITSVSYEDTGYNIITIKNQDESELLSIEPQSEGYVYVELRIKEDCINSVIDMVNSDGTENYVKLDNITEITSYGSTRFIKDENGNIIGEELYAGIDKDSQPGNTDVTNQDTWEDDTDKAPGLKLVLQEERTVSGKVFLDSSNELNVGEIANDGEIRQGNGSLDEDENGIQGVEVRLIDLTGNQTNPVATDITDERGEYQFTNFIPGDYVIEYEWGDETYKVQNYKSTVVNQEAWEAKISSDSNGQWYKDEFKQNYTSEWNGENEIRTSDAIDDIGDDSEEIQGTRKEIDDQTEEITYGKKEKVDNAYTNNVDEGNDIETKMISTTPMFKVNVEYSTDITNTKDEYSMDENEEYTNPIPEFKNNITSIDFGIVERARQVLELDKYVKSVKVILTNGNILINAQLDENGNLLNSPSYVTAVPNSAVNGQIKLEIDQEVIQGATLETEYNLKVTNASEIDYATRDFYMYGTVPDNTDKLVKLRATTIIDYLDNSITTNMENNGAWEIVNKQEWKNTGKIETDRDRNYDEMLLSKEIEETFNQTDRILTTEELDSNILSPLDTETKSVDVGIIGYRLLSNTTDEVYFENYSEIIKVSKENGGSIVVTTPGNYVPNESSTYEEDDATSQSVTLVPPTGLSANYIAYILLTLSSLGILVSGIILIKRYVLKND